MSVRLRSFPDIAFMRWAKTRPRVRFDLARSGMAPCPIELLGLTPGDLAAPVPAGYGWPPLQHALARRYGVSTETVVPLSGGTSLANWLACAAALDGAPRGAEVIVERPTYEPLLRIPQALGFRVRRLDRRWRDGFALDLDRFARLVTPRTRLAIVSNLHNPSGVALSLDTLRAMAERLAAVGAFLLVDEVYLEATFLRGRPQSCIHAGPNVIATNSLTKAYGLDGLRAGWLLAPEEIARRAWRIHDYLGVNPVAPGLVMTLAALRRLRPIAARSRAILAPNLEILRQFLAAEPCLACPQPGTASPIAFPRLPRGVGGDAFAERLLRRYSTLVAPGRFFEAPEHVRLATGGLPPECLRRSLSNLTRALDDLLP